MDIDKLLLKVMNNEATKEEYNALEQWKSESQENIQLLQELASGNKNATDYQDFDKEAAWEKVESQIEPTQSPKVSSNTTWYVVAGIAILAIAAYFFLPEKETQPSVYKSDADEVMAFALEDRSKIWLNEGGSAIEIKSDFQSERRVALSGEAFFDIAPDKDRPFIIEVANNDFIRVLGTSFNIINEDDEFDLTVYSGTVELHTLNRVLTLTKNDRVTRINGAMAKVKNNDQNKLSWKTKELIFENSALNQVFEALEDHYNVNIQVESNGTLGKCRIRTRFAQESITKVMKELSAQYSFKYEIDSNNISVSGLSCN